MASVPVMTTTMSRFGTTYDINAINNLALKSGLKPLTPAQFKQMTPAQVKSYLKSAGKALKLNRKNLRQVSSAMRKNAKLTTSENYKQAQLMHGTIRQGLAELGSLGTQALAQYAFTRPKQSASAIGQNVTGGTVDTNDGSGTEKGPVYAFKSRDED